MMRSPIFGKYFGPSYSCALWPVRPDVQLHPTGVGAAPLLVIGGLAAMSFFVAAKVLVSRAPDSGVLGAVKAAIQFA
mgnify:CR=1 FL=1